MGAPGDIQPNNTFQTLLNTFTGKTTTRSASSGIDSAGMAALLKSILEGTQGLSAVTQGQNNAGLYNSTVNQQLVNDLMTRSAAEVSKAGKGVTETTKVAPQIDPKTGLLATLGLSAGQSLLGPTISGIGKKAGLDELGNKIAESLGFSTGPAWTSAVASGSGSLGTDFAGSVGGDFSSGIADSVSSLAPEALSSFIDTLYNSGAGEAASGVADVVSSAGSGIADFFSSLFGGIFGADGGKIPPAHKQAMQLMMQQMMKSKTGMADGGSVEDPLRKKFSGGAATGYSAIDPVLGNAINPEATLASLNATSDAQLKAILGGTGDAGDSASLGVAPEGASMGINGPLGAVVGLASMNPALAVMGVVNMASNIVNGKEAFPTLLGLLGLGPQGLADNSIPGEPDSTPGLNPGGLQGGIDGPPGPTGPPGINDANGGKIPMQSGDPRGIKDTVVARVAGGPKVNLSGGEFIIPKDVVDSVGEDFFAKLIAQFHTPAAMQPTH